ncbi:MAG: Oxygen tolerance [Candidatus Krumholzibacteriota bacterium]|nr:Oxygen tolerance [Candidatus Krumholzibacteriota bacterium]
MGQVKLRSGLVFTALLAVIVAHGAGAADVSITAVVEPNVVAVGSEVTLVVTVKGKFTKSENPELPPLADFTVYQAGTSQSYSFGTGGASSSLQFTYVLVPKNPGTFTIEPIRFRAGDKIYTADPVTLEVVQSPRQMSVPQSTEKSGPDENADQPMFIRATVDRDTVYVNQQVTWALGFYTDGRLNLMRTPEYSPPAAEDFWAEELPSQKSYYKQIQGRQYLVNEVKRAFFASAPGEYTIGPAQVNLVIDDFGQRPRDRFFDDFFNRSFGGFGFGKPVSLKTKDIAVTVLPLPLRGRPANFSGLVGRSLELSVTADKNVAQVGEPITLKLEIQGEGNFKTMSAPAIPQPQGFKMYESGTSSDLFKKGDVVSGRKKYEYVLIPQVEGEKTVPAVELSYFDPAAKTYKTVRSAPIRLDVKPGAAEDGRRVVYAGSGEDIELLGKDINYIHPVPAVIRPATRTFVDSKLYLAAHAVPLFALLASIVVERRRKRLRDDVRLARASRAARKAEKSLDRARGLFKQGKRGEVYPLVSSALRGYLADKMNAAEAGLTRDDLERFLGEKGVRDEDAAELRSILNACDSAQYAPSVSDTKGDEGAGDIVARAAEALKILDKRYLS